MSLKRHRLQRKDDRTSASAEETEKPMFSKETATTLKTIVLGVVALVIVAVFDSNPPVRKLDEIWTIIVICGVLYFAMNR